MSSCLVVLVSSVLPRLFLFLLVPVLLRLLSGLVWAEFSIPQLSFCYLDSLTIGNQDKQSYKAAYQLAKLTLVFSARSHERCGTSDYNYVTKLRHERIWWIKIKHFIKFIFKIENHFVFCSFSCSPGSTWWSE